MIKSSIPEIDVDAVRQEILERDPAKATAFEGAEFRVEQVQYDAAQLNAWYVEVKTVVIRELPEGLFDDWTLSDLDEENNRIVVEFSTDEAQAWARQQIADKMEGATGAIVVVHFPAAQLDEGEYGSQ